MFNDSRIDIYDYLAAKFKTITANVYSMGEPTENTKSDVEDGFIVVRVGVMNDDSEFDGEAYGWARCTVTAYVPKKTRGRLNKELYKTFEDGINGIIKQEQQAQDEYYIATDGVVSLDNDETAQQGNQYHVFIKSFLVVIDQPKEQQQE